jgi:outer membrane protein assembly factor BamB
MSDHVTPAPRDPQSRSDLPEAGRHPRLRLWPGIALLAVFWLVRGWASMGEFATYKFLVGMLIAPFVVLLGLLLWWLLASRLRWYDRLLVVGTFVAVTTVTLLVADPSFRSIALVVYALPILVTAWPGWLAISFLFAWPVRRAGVLLILVAVGIGCSLLRLDGVNGDFVAKFSWRWTPTPEQKLLAELARSARTSDSRSTHGVNKQSDSKSRKPAARPGDAGENEQPGDWPGFRGPRRDGRLAGVRIKTDWRQPPRELWRHRIGPGWSSFAVVGDSLFTQEQRGDDECVVCYNAATGAEVWTHHDATRFSEMVAGPGPRATPTFHAGRLYAFGANGHLSCLDAASGNSLWSRDVVADCKASVPQWGFASSPLVAQGMVTVFAGAPKAKTLVAYHQENGEPAWTAGVGPESDKAALSYSSPQLATIHGVDQILLATDAGLSAFEPVSGRELWHHSWPAEKAARIVQPALVGDGDVLIGTGQGIGTRRIHVRRDGETWRAEQKWTSRKIKAYFNDFVVVRGYLYGFDTGKFVCVSVEDGSEAWHTRGYGNGQVLLLADQGLLLVLSEDGNVALVSAQPEKHEELCRFKAIEGKTWNHPVVAHGKLFVRNGEEIACFDVGKIAK